MSLREALYRSFRQDWVLRLVVGGWIVLALPFLLPGLSAEALGFWSWTVSDPALLVLTLIALLHRLNDIASARERLFWILFASAFSLWLLAELLLVALPTLELSRSFAVFTDCFYLIYYLLLIYAAESRPDKGTELARSVDDRYNLAGAGVFAVALVAYFVLAPAFVDHQAYDSWRPSAVLYLGLDLLVAGLFAYLAFTTRSRRYRYLYGLLSLAFALSALTMWLEYWSLGGSSPVPLEVGTPWDLIWFLPLMPVAVAARLRHGLALERTPLGAPVSSLRQASAPLILYTFGLPLMHLLLRTLGLSEAEIDAWRDRVVIVSVLVLGALALAQYWSRERDSRRITRRQRETQSQLRALQVGTGAMRLGLMVSSRNGVILYANPALAGMHGCRLDELIGRPVSSLIVDAEKLFAPVLAHWGETFTGLADLTCLDGPVLPIQVAATPVRGDSGEVVGAVTSIEDVTERLAAEQALRDSQERYRRLVENLPDAVLVVQDDRIVFANPAAQELLDQHSQAPEADLGALRLPGSEADDAGSDSGVSGLQRTVLPASGRIRTPAGEELEVEVSYRRINYLGQPARQIIVRDVTALRRLQSDTQRMQRLASLGQMSATIAHEIRNPLGSMMLNCQLLEQAGEGARETETIEDIRLGISRMQGLVDGILDFARERTLSLETADLIEIVEAAVRGLGMDREDETPSLERRYSHTSARVRVDPHHMQRALTNILDNARRAVGVEGGIVLGSRNRRQRLEIWVEDDGCGLPEGAHDRIFDPFFTTRPDGIGLGLAVVAQILTDHGCAYSMTSEANRGSRFEISLPLAGDSEHPV